MSCFHFNLWQAARWEKVRGADNQYRYYELALQQDIFGEWEVVRRWGRIGQRGGTSARRVWPCYEDAHADFVIEAQRRERRDYVLREIEKRDGVLVGSGAVAHTIQIMREPTTGFFTLGAATGSTALQTTDGGHASAIPFCLR